MASIKNLEMAEAIAQDSRISIKKTLFGQKATYIATGSAVKAYKHEYSAENGEVIKQLLKCPSEQVEAFVSETPRPSLTGVGPLLLEICASCDKQFAALQAFTYYDLSYHPIQDIRVFEGKAAESVITFLIG